MVGEDSNGRNGAHAPADISIDFADLVKAAEVTRLSLKVTLGAWQFEANGERTVVLAELRCWYAVVRDVQTGMDLAAALNRACTTQPH